MAAPSNCPSRASDRSSDSTFLTKPSLTCQAGFDFPSGPFHSHLSEQRYWPGQEETARTHVWGVKRMISTRREGWLAWAGSRVLGAWVPKPTLAILRLLNQPADWIECFSTR